MDLGQMIRPRTPRPGQDATAEGLDAGSGGYLARPFTAGELVARVRSTVELSRLRLHESRFGRALIESLEEGFFVCDDQGVFLDVNDVFGQIVGYGPEGLPYPRPYPWEPDPVREPELRRVFDTVAQDAHAAEGRPVHLPDPAPGRAHGVVRDHRAFRPGLGGPRPGLHRDCPRRDCRARSGRP